jgi:carboxypeptidase family protein
MIVAGPMTRSIPAVLLLIAAALLVGCAGAASTQAPPPSSPTLAPRTITSVEDAAARVQEVHPELAGIGPKDPDVIGGCCFWEGSPAGDGYTVRFEVGWGDCPSGCIDRHSWTFAVSSDGAVELIDEQGPPVPDGVPGAGLDAGGGSSGGGSGGSGGLPAGATGIEGRLVAGPTCPVVQPNDPACADRPLPGVTVVVLTAAGTEAARTTTDAEGFYAIPLPPGPYTIEPQQIEGMMRGSAPIDVVVGDGVVTVDIPYDTGIR